MKRIILFLTLLFAQKLMAQTWQPLGPNDFNQASYELANYPNLVFNGNVPYVVYKNGFIGNAMVQKYNGTRPLHNHW